MHPHVCLFDFRIFLAHLIQWVYFSNQHLSHVCYCLCHHICCREQLKLKKIKNHWANFKETYDMDNWAKCSQFSRKWGIKYSCNYLYMSVKINHCHVFFYYQGRLLFMFTDWNFWKYHFLTQIAHLFAYLTYMLIIQHVFYHNQVFSADLRKRFKVYWGIFRARTTALHTMTCFIRNRFHL